MADRRAPTISDVARRAGVGVGTVSRVLNDSPRVSASTHERVREAIEALGYRRNAAARSLSLGRGQAVGLVAPFFTTPSVVERVRGVAGCLAERGYDLVLFDVETTAQRNDVFSDFARRDRLTGLLIISLPVADAEVTQLEREGLPAVLVDVGHPRLPSVSIDDRRGGELAARHLLERGHRRVGFVGDAGGNPFGFTSSEERRLGMQRALRRAGVKPDPELAARGPHGRVEARALADRLLRRPDPPTAIFAASDIQAVGVLEAAQARGLRVPEDLAVVGCDDIELSAMLGLTTVRQPLEAIGRRGAELLLAAVEGCVPPARQELRPLELVVRATT